MSAHLADHSDPESLPLQTGQLPEDGKDRADNSIRILVISDAAPARNGVGSYYADLVEQLGQRVGAAVLFHPSSQHAPAYRYLTAPLPGDKTQRIGVPRPVLLWKSFKRFSPTVIIVPTPGPFGLAGLYLSRRFKVPLIVGFHTNYEALAELYWQNLMGQFSQRFLSWCNRLLFRQATDVLANSPEMVRQAIDGGARTASLMGTSVPYEFVSTSPVELPDSVSRVLFAGRLADEKNLPMVIEAAEQHPELKFTIAGDGPLRNMVERSAAELKNLQYKGWVNRAELLTLMDEHQVLLLPSKVESFGTVALEGMARGRLVIVTGSCGIAEWSELSEALFVVNENETPSEALARVCQLSPAARLQISEKARQQALRLNYWNIETWLRRLHDARSATTELPSEGAR